MLLLILSFGRLHLLGQGKVLGCHAGVVGGDA